MADTRLRFGAIWMLVLAGALFTPASAQAEKQVLRLLFNGPIAEAPVPDAELMVLLGGEKPMTTLGLIRKLEKAADDADVAGIAMIIEQPSLNLAQVEEITRALKAFRAKGKLVHAYIDYATNLSYALAAAADHITIAENSQLDIVGLSAELSFYKNMLDKIGVQADMLRCGAYKAAAEPFIRSEPSPEFAENINWLLDGLYARWLGLIAEGRKLDVKAVEKAVDEGPLSAEEALKAKLVDVVGSYDDYKTRLHKEFGADVEFVKRYDEKKLEMEIDPSNPFSFFMEMNRVMEELFGGAKETDKPGIGVVYVDGGIMVGPSQNDPFSGSTAGSTSVRAALEQARQDENVKAVVLRVSSPGGSAIASDIIWKAATQLAKEKPLVVSMGGVAGSGGYYVSIPGETIFADESTITASIGVVGGKLIWNELWENKIGITTTEFHRGKHAGLMSFNRPWTEEERAWVTKWMNEVYTQFKARIQTSRGDRIKGDLESMAGGRVFTGKQALERGLVDKIGGLADALAYAADKAGLDKPQVFVFPREKGLAEVFAQLMGEETEDDWELHSTPLGRDPLLRLAAPLLSEAAPHQLRTLLSALQNLALLNRERVGCFMPYGLNIR
ncbi:MAG: signal peptide peptidase SppA [Phycisphaerae bacterium]|jgi:protease-4